MSFEIFFIQFSFFFSFSFFLLLICSGCCEEVWENEYRENHRNIWKVFSFDGRTECQRPFWSPSPLWLDQCWDLQVIFVFAFFFSLFFVDIMRDWKQNSYLDILSSLSLSQFIDVCQHYHWDISCSKCVFELFERQKKPKNYNQPTPCLFILFLTFPHFFSLIFSLSLDLDSYVLQSRFLVQKCDSFFGWDRKVVRRCRDREGSGDARQWSVCTPKLYVWDRSLS